MLRAMLTSRFKLTLHHESKEMPVYSLSVAKSGSKLHESAAEGEPPFRGVIDQLQLPAVELLEPPPPLDRLQLFAGVGRNQKVRSIDAGSLSRYDVFPADDKPGLRHRQRLQFPLDHC